MRSETSPGSLVSRRSPLAGSGWGSVLYAQTGSDRAATAKRCPERIAQPSAIGRPRWRRSHRSTRSPESRAWLSPWRSSSVAGGRPKGRSDPTGRRSSSRACRHRHRRQMRFQPLLAEAFFLPRIGVVVVAVALPEAELIVIEELETADPLGALPEIPLRYEQAERVTMFGLERLAVEGVGEEHVVVVEDLDRQVRGVALLGMTDDV